MSDQTNTQLENHPVKVVIALLLFMKEEAACITYYKGLFQTPISSISEVH